jgi:hypothetical protein
MFPPRPSDDISKDLKSCFALLMNKDRLILSSAVPAFRDVIDVPLVVRRLHKSRSEVCMILLASVTLQA